MRNKILAAVIVTALVCGLLTLGRLATCGIFKTAMNKEG